MEKVKSYHEKRLERQGKEEELALLEPAVANHDWASEAVGLYSDLISRREPMMKENPIFLILAAASFVATLVFGFFKTRWGMGVGATLTTTFAWVHLSRGTKSSTLRRGNQGNREPTSRIYEWVWRGIDRLSDPKARAAMLKTDGIKAELLKEELQKLKFAINILWKRVHAEFQHFAGEEIPFEEWEGKAVDWRRERKDLEKSKAEIERQLLLLGVSEENFISEDPGTEWNAEKAQCLEEKDRGHRKPSPRRKEST